MSDWDPLKMFHNRANEICSSVWKYMDTLSEHIKTLPEGKDKQYLEQYTSTLGLIAELAFINAATFTRLDSLDQTVYKVLFKEVFGDRTIKLP